MFSIFFTASSNVVGGRMIGLPVRPVGFGFWCLGTGCVLVVFWFFAIGRVACSGSGNLLNQPHFYHPIEYCFHLIIGIAGRRERLSVSVVITDISIDYSWANTVFLSNSLFFFVQNADLQLVLKSGNEDDDLICEERL